MLRRNNFTGKFVVIYGPNNMGKTTQMQLLARRLIEQKNYIAYMKYPVYNLAPTGPMINEILRQSQMCLDLGKDRYTVQISKILGRKLTPLNVEKAVQGLYARNRRDFQPNLLGMIRAGMTVLAEDYTGTGIAWGMTRDVELKYLEKINANLIGPDIAILLDGERFIMGVEEGHRNEDTADIMWLKNREIYRLLAKKYGWITVNANGTIEEIHERIWNALDTNLR